jgi:hypothetical protein
MSFLEVRIVHRSSLLSLLSVRTRAFASLGAALLVLAASHSTVLAATPVDMYQDMESGNNGDVLTATIMNASSHPNSGWSAPSGTLWVSTSHHSNLPGPVTVGGVTYNGTGGTRSWVFNDNNASNFVAYSTWGNFQSKVTVACYYTTDSTIVNTRQYDNIAMMPQLGKTFTVMQTISDGAGPQIRAHSKDSAGNVVFSPSIRLTSGKAYWINLKYDASALTSYLAAYDPANSFAQVGSTVTCGSASDGMYGYYFGRYDAHGNQTNDLTQSWFDQVVIDWTNAAFPLIPSSGADSTPPSAPPAVRDGTSSDIVYTNSTTQLSANWDASTDNESGISGYQYAIGTSAGGTQTVNWTSLGNVTTVTKTGLALTNGQTYYFGVRAINGAGLTGSATNSNGQTVDSTAPSAPATVRDGTGTDIATTSSTTQLSANWDASTDAESGISGYQYAIGTSAGGTQTVNWTSLGNVTTVTKTGLALTVGQTYFFSVRAINGAGLTGSATNSNGQTVVSGGGSVTYFQDNFESWTVHGGAWSSVNGEAAGRTLDTSTDFAKAGAKGLKLTDTDSTATGGASLTKTFSPVISGDIYVRFFAYLPTGWATANSCTRVLYVWCGSNRAQVSFMNGGYVALEEVGAYGGFMGPKVSENAWHCIEVHVAPPSASTQLQMWVDGTSAGTLTANFSASSTFDHIDLGYLAYTASASNGTFYVDELVVSNSYIGTGITSPVTYFQDTFDSWAAHGGAWSSISGETASHTLNTSTDQARSGTKSLKLTDTDTTSINGAYLTKNFSPTISGDIYVRFYVFLPTGFEAANPNCNRRVLRMYCGTNRGQMTLRAGQPVMEEVGAWGAALGSTLSENAWHCIEMHITTPSATTALEFWVDGVRNSTALTANFSTSSTWDHIDLGDIVLGSGGNGTGTYYMDEAVVSNSYIGPLP